jgi:nicotinamide mononucleotide transporter
VLCAKGKISFYYIGFIQTISYLYLAWQNRFYGEVAENIFYLVTMVIGIFLWRANSGKLDDGRKYVKAKVMSGKMWIVSLLATVASTILTGVFLESIGSQQAYTDAATNVLAIFAQILMIKGYREQWAWWIAIDLICIKLWLVAGNWSMVAMYIAWTINCIYGWYHWSMLNNRQKLQLCVSNLGGIL